MLAAAVAGVVLLVRVRHLLLRIVSGALVIMLSAGAGMAVVNDYYGY
jgi:hypothetical protein